MLNKKNNYVSKPIQSIFLTDILIHKISFIKIEKKNMNTFLIVKRSASFKTFIILFLIICLLITILTITTTLNLIRIQNNNSIAKKKLN